MLSRDADSSIMKREVDAVQEWLISNYTFHAMRDAHHHCRFYILGGLIYLYCYFLIFKNISSVYFTYFNRYVGSEDEPGSITDRVYWNTDIVRKSLHKEGV